MDHLGVYLVLAGWRVKQTMNEIFSVVPSPVLFLARRGVYQRHRLYPHTVGAPSVSQGVSQVVSETVNSRVCHGSDPHTFGLAVKSHWVVG
jgi:hypothetical protein